MKQIKSILILLIQLCLVFNLTNSEALTEDNWRKLLDDQEWMIKFYAPWCPACNRLEPVWKEFEKKSKELNIRVGSVDLTKYPSLSGLFSVTSLPTIYHVKDKQYRVYEGSRDLNDFVDYVKEQKWRYVTPLSGWLTPDSFIMKVVGYLFKVTLYFKDLYTLMSEEYGLPNWAVLSLFIVATVLLGLLLGILLIICIDFICTPRKHDVPKDFKDDELISGDDESTKKNDGKNEEGKEHKKTTTPDNLVKRRHNLRKE